MKRWKRSSDERLSTLRNIRTHPFETVRSSPIVASALTCFPFDYPMTSVSNLSG
jgi:hypothetical protein